MKMGVMSVRINRAAFALAALLFAGMTVGQAAMAQVLAPSQSVQSRGVFAVERILVSGNRRIEAATIESYLAIKPGDAITDAALNESLRRLFDTGLFSNATIEPEGNTLIVRVVENPSINQIAFEGNDEFEDEALAAAIQSRPRTSFTRSKAEADAQTLVEFYRRAGRFAAIVDPVVIEQSDNRVDLVFEINEGPTTGVNSIRFVGNEIYSNRRLRNAIETSESDLFAQLRSADNYDPDRLELDKELLRQFYLSRGYADFRVLSAVAELAPDREGFFITFTVEEGPLYNFGAISVTSTTPGLDVALFTDLLEPEEGDVYNNRLVERTIDALALRAGQEGFAFVDIRPRIRRDTDLQVVDVEFEIGEGDRVYLERIDIEGNIRTLDRVIRRQFDLAEGDAFDSRKVADARDRLRALGYFRTVEVTTEQGSAADRAVVRVKVEEQSTGSLSFGVGFSTGVGVVGNISLTEKNFLGRGQTLGATVQAAGTEQIYRLNFVEPAFLDRDLEVGFDLYYSDEDLSDESSFEVASIGYEPHVAFPLDPYTRVRLGYTIRNDEIRDIRSDASPLIRGNTALGIEGEAGDVLESSINLGITYDRRNSRAEPTDGYILGARTDVAGLGGDANFVRAVANAKGYKSFFEEDVVASLELEGGAIFSFGDDVRIIDRFFLGGDTFRGFARSGIGPRDSGLRRISRNNNGVRTGTVVNDALGGKYYGVMRADVTFPLGVPDDWGIYGGVFSDVGTLFGLDNDSYTDLAGDTFTFDSIDLRASAGVSLFWDSAFGPLRLNVGFPLIKEDGDEEELFRLSAGTRF